MLHTDSILISVKKMLGIMSDQKDFDQDIIIHINSVFSILSDLGVGPENGFSITDENATWSSYINDDVVILEKVKTYMYLKVRLLFDPPQHSYLVESIKSLTAEYEWRLNVNAENKDKDGV